MSDRIILVNKFDDIDLNTKYFSLNLSYPLHKEVEYLIKNGDGHLFSDTINDVSGFVFVSYEIFLKSELIIKQIFKSLCSKDELYKARQLYIELGKKLSVGDDEDNMFSSLSINNVWGALSSGISTSYSASKLYQYVCKKVGISCSVDNESGIFFNKVVIGNRLLKVDLYKDIENIQAGFKTMYFDTFNDDIEMDKKIKYIKDDYNDNRIENVLKSINLNKKNVLPTILSKTSKILNVEQISRREVSKIYKRIFSTYCSDFDIFVNNMEIKKNGMNMMVINQDDNYYTYSYCKNKFIGISKSQLFDKISNHELKVFCDTKLGKQRS